MAFSSILITNPQNSSFDMHAVSSLTNLPAVTAQIASATLATSALPAGESAWQQIGAIDQARLLLLFSRCGGEPGTLPLPDMRVGGDSQINLASVFHIDNLTAFYESGRSMVTNQAVKCVPAAPSCLAV